MSASNVTVYAHWTRTSNEVIYKDWDGTIIDRQNVAIGGNATPPADPGRTGYTFIGWDKESTNIQANTTITAKYSKNSYKLTLDGNGGTIAGKDTREQQLTYGDSFDQILSEGAVEASQKYYTFAGWYTDKTGGSKYSGSGNIMPASNVTVYAHWTRTSNEVIYQDWDGRELDSQVVAIGGNATPPADPVRPGYTFTGWDISSTNIQVHTIITAQYSKNGYKLTLDGNGGTLNGKDTREQQLVYGDSFDQILTEGAAEASQEYYTFSGWYTDKIGGIKYAGSGNIMPASNVTVYAHWTRTSNEVIYQDWDGRIIDRQDVEIGGNATPPVNPGRTGYTFTGWDKESTNIQVNTTIKAKYSKNSYKLILDGNGGTIAGKDTREQQLTYGDSFDQILADGNIISRPGYIFEGWYSAPIGGNRYSYSGNVMPSNDLTVYAHWKVKSYNVDFDSNHKRWVGGVIRREYTTGTKFGNLPDPEIYGWEFLGWWSGRNGAGEKATEDTITGTQDVTYYGNWKANTYQIRYISEVKQPTGKSVQEFPVTQTYDAAIGTMPEPVEAGYTFLGWYDGNEKVTPETIFSPASGAEGYTYHAGWKANRYTIYFDKNLNTVEKNPANKIVTYGEVVGDLPVLNAEGYTFIGWYTEPTGGEKVIETTPVSEDTTYYAHWDTVPKPMEPKPTEPEPSKPESRDKEEIITVLVPPSIDSKAKPTVPDTGGNFNVNPDNPYDVTYTKPDGTSARDEWVGDGSDWYHVNEDSKLSYDWYLEGENTWYKLNKEPGKFGAALTGWNRELMDDKWYFFEPATTKMLTGWQRIDNKMYYFTEKNQRPTYSGDNKKGWEFDFELLSKPLGPMDRPYGCMYKNEYTPDGYWVDENGICVDKK